MKRPKLLVIGLDAAVPEFIFNKWNKFLPNLNSLINKGISGILRSCFPPITVPAWMCMFTGKDPGELGIYGFRNRKNFNYEELQIITSQNVKAKTIWDFFATEQNKKSIVIGVPPTYPPKKLNGIMISCFLTPQNSTKGIYPAELYDELMELSNDEYMFDVYNFRNRDKSVLLNDIYKMTEKRFNVAANWIKSKPWDLFILMEIGLDRLQHAFWSYHDPSHPLYEKNNQFKNAIRDYYIFLDKKIGEILKIIPDDLSILIVSDHGAKAMTGGFCVNEWLIKNNFLKLKKNINGLTTLNTGMIDWKNTIAWAEGGYYGRLFLNVSGREPEGIVSPDDYEKTLNAIELKLSSIKHADNVLINVKTFRPEELYINLNGIPPDLFIVFNDFEVRSIGTIGSNKLFVLQNDTGADGANHDPDGIYILKSNKIPDNSFSNTIDAEIYNIFPTLCNLLELNITNETEYESLFKINSKKKNNLS